MYYIFIVKHLRIAYLGEGFINMGSFFRFLMNIDSFFGLLIVGVALDFLIRSIRNRAKVSKIFAHLDIIPEKKREYLILQFFAFILAFFILLGIGIFGLLSLDFIIGLILAILLYLLEVSVELLASRSGYINLTKKRKKRLSIILTTGIIATTTLSIILYRSISTY